MSDLVVLSLEPWDRVWRRNQYLVDGLLRRDADLRVLWVGPDADPVHDVMSRRCPRRGQPVRQAGPPDTAAYERLWTTSVTKWSPRRLDQALDRRWAGHVRSAASRLRLREPALWVNDPRGAEVMTLTGWPTLYDVTDDWLLADRSDAEHTRLEQWERQLLERADEVVVCSRELKRSKSATRSVTLVPNAVDLAAYNGELDRPADLPPGPVALYVGTVHPDRVDVELVTSTARRLRPCVRVALLGPVLLDGTSRKQLVEAGVHLLGARDRALVPAYLRHADVLVVPHLVTPFTQSLDPIKVYEYAAAGRPVVSTPVAGFVDRDEVTVTERGGFADQVLRLATASVVSTPQHVPTWADRVTAMAEVLARVRHAPAQPRR